MPAASLRATSSGGTAAAPQRKRSSDEMSRPERSASSSRVERKNGVPALAVMRCSSMSAAAARALQRSITTVVPPAVSGRSKPRSAATWPAGKVPSIRLEASTGTAVRPHSSVSWLCCTPLGSAVEPEV